jgi:hypothetical protein
MDDTARSSLLGTVPGCHGNFCHYSEAMLGANEKGEDFASTEGDVAHDSGFVVPYRCVVQARHENHLVQLLLRRHRLNKKGEYVNEDIYQDLMIAIERPAYYHKPVHVCETCFKVCGRMQREQSAQRVEYRCTTSSRCTGTER